MISAPAINVSAPNLNAFRAHVILYRQLLARQVRVDAARDARKGVDNSAYLAANSHLYYCYWAAHDETARTMTRKLP